MLFDAFRCRTLWLIGDTTGSVAAYLAASIAARFAILSLENRSKRSILIDDWKLYGREATSGLLSRSVLFWANDFLLQGHKSILAASNLYALKQDLQSKLLLHRMGQHWSKYRTSGKNALFWNLLVSCRATILVAAVPRIGQAACKVAEPFLVSRVISYVQRQGTPEADSLDAGYALIAAVTLVCVLRRVSSIFACIPSFRLPDTNCTSRSLITFTTSASSAYRSPCAARSFRPCFTMRLSWNLVPRTDPLF